MTDALIQPTRATSSLVRVAEQWVSGSHEPARARDYVTYLKNFFAHFITNPNTRRSYSFAVLEFFDWYEATFGGTVPTPDRIERSVALRYTDWLRTRQYGVEEHRLRRSHDRQLEAAIYDIVRRHPDVHIDAIRRELLLRSELTVGSPRVLRIEQADPAGLDRFLACLVIAKLLERAPTVEELRRANPELLSHLDSRVDPQVFAYRIDPHTDARGVQRASSIATRLSALSSFWRYLIEHTGENTGDRRALLTVNIWQDPLHQVMKSVGSVRAATRAMKTPGRETLDKLLRTTYRDEAVSIETTRFEDIRDRAILVVLDNTGLRAEELCSLRRSDVTGSPPVVTVVGKGDRVRQFVLPAPAASVLHELTRKIELLAHEAEKRSPNTVPRQTLLLRDEAPLFPAVANWGCNAQRRGLGLTRAGISMMLGRRADAAGIPRGSPERRRIHPHGFRHLAAKTAVDKGIPLPTIQGVLGHGSLSTTGIYVEEHDARALSLAPVAAPPAAAPPPVAPPPSAVVDTYGYEVAEADEEAAPVDEPLVGIGSQGPPQRPLPSELEIAAAEGFDDVYTRARWGEKGDRQRIHAKKREVAGSEASRGDDLLVNTYVGDHSGLVWWTGPRESLKPEMPILSPRQVLDDAVRHGLEELWLRWVSNKETGRDGVPLERGPTAARALLEWFRAGLDVTEQAAAELKRRGGFWAPYESPALLTQADGGRADTFREHPGSKVVLWYELRGYTFMASVGDQRRTGGVLDTGTSPSDAMEAGNDYRPIAPDTVALPSWYDLPDPVAALPADERTELLDWLMVLTGRPPIDATKRFPRTPGGAAALSRVDLAKLLLQLCAFDDANDEREMAHRKNESREQIAAAEEHADMVADVVNLTAAELKAERRGDAFPFDIAARVKARTGRKARAGFYLDVLRELFGDEAADDPALGIYALCGRDQPLAHKGLPFGGEYRDFFRVDTKQGTIVHTPDFAEQFAVSTGAHSECVARRVARHMWELRRAKHQDATSRIDRLIPKLATWTFYRVPCPAPLEAELRARLRGAPPVDLQRAFEAFAEGQVDQGGTGSRERREARAAMEDLVSVGQERTAVVDPGSIAEGFTVEARGPREKPPEAPPAPVTRATSEELERVRAQLAEQRKYIANARTCIPGPITILLLVYT